jgi:hypothetical protein
MRAALAMPAAAAMLAVGGCGAAAPSALDDAAYLAVGVDPTDALDDAATSLASAGQAEVRRVERERFTAGSYAAIDGRTAVRVATRRGLALALDGTADSGALLGLEVRSGEDLDGDGAPDLVVERREQARTCLALVGVDELGVLRPVATDPSGLDPDACIEELVDLDHDGRVEALVRAASEALLEDAVPAIAIPLSLDARGVFVRASWPAGFAGDEVARREAAVELAVDRGDARQLLRLAVELAWLSHERDGDATRALATFDGVIDRIRPTPADAAAVRQGLLSAGPPPRSAGPSASASASE